MVSSPDSTRDASGQRLQKVLAEAGIGSRRECETLIAAGRVEVDRQVVTEMGTRVDPQTTDIRIDGERIRRSKKQYFILNKPQGVVSTNHDPDGRPRVIDLIPSSERLFPVGRLDRNSEGLMLVTNDGELANQLTHPRFGVEKTYIAFVAGQPPKGELDQLCRGVRLAEGVARASSVKVRRRHARGTELEIVLKEGKNREIRRILAKIGHKVMRLRRVAIGPVRLGKLGVGECRRLSADELSALRRSHGKNRSSVKTGKPSSRKKPAAAPASPRKSGKTAKTNRTGTVIGGDRRSKPSR